MILGVLRVFVTLCLDFRGWEVYAWIAQILIELLPNMFYNQSTYLLSNVFIREIRLFMQFVINFSTFKEKQRLEKGCPISSYKRLSGT